MAAQPDDDEAAAPDEEIVAYLDGELDPREANAVEAKLAKDAVARTKADALRKTYDLLDYLPKSEPSSTFASRTLTKLEPASAPIPVPPPPSEPVPTLTAPLPRPARARSWAIIAWSVAALFAAGFGYLGHLIAKPHLEKAKPPTSQQVRLFERLPFYLGVDDLAFLQMLDESDLFGDHEAEPEAIAKSTEAVSSADLAKLEETFRKLPAARQQQLQKLDEDFFALEPAKQARLSSTLERYAVWLDRLPENYRREVLAAPAAEERLEAIRRIRNRLWREHLPAAVKAKLDETANQDEADRIREEYKNQEAERRRTWQLARQQWNNLNSDKKPFPFDNPDLAKQVEEFVTVSLKPRLLPNELAALEESRIAWYLYGAEIYHLAEKHPPLPEPKNGKPITKVEDLPVDFLKKLRAANPSPTLRPPRKDFKDLPQAGKWPEFAELIAREAQDRGVPLPGPLGPCRPGEFKPEVEEALAKLRGKITSKEKADLDALAGKWSAYPKRFVELARKYEVPIPGLAMLPGPPQQWTNVYASRLRR